MVTRLVQYRQYLKSQLRSGNISKQEYHKLYYEVSSQRIQRAQVVAQRMESPEKQAAVEEAIKIVSEKQAAKDKAERFEPTESPYHLDYVPEQERKSYLVPEERKIQTVSTVDVSSGIPRQKIVGIVDSVAGVSRAAPKGYEYSQSVIEREEQRREREVEKQRIRLETAQRKQQEESFMANYGKQKLMSREQLYPNLPSAKKGELKLESLGQKYKQAEQRQSLMKDIMLESAVKSSTFGLLNVDLRKKEGEPLWKAVPRAYGSLYVGGAADLPVVLGRAAYLGEIALSDKETRQVAYSRASKGFIPYTKDVAVSMFRKENLPDTIALGTMFAVSYGSSVLGRTAAEVNVAEGFGRSITFGEESATGIMVSKNAPYFKAMKVSYGELGTSGVPMPSPRVSSTTINIPTRYAPQIVSAISHAKASAVRAGVTIETPYWKTRGVVRDLGLEIKAADSYFNEARDVAKVKIIDAIKTFMSDVKTQVKTDVAYYSARRSYQFQKFIQPARKVVEIAQEKAEPVIQTAKTKVSETLFVPVKAKVAAENLFGSVKTQVKTDVVYYSAKRQYQYDKYVRTPMLKAQYGISQYAKAKATQAQYKLAILFERAGRVIRPVKERITYGMWWQKQAAKNLYNELKIQAETDVKYYSSKRRYGFNKAMFKVTKPYYDIKYGVGKLKQGVQKQFEIDKQYYGAKFKSKSLKVSMPILFSMGKLQTSTAKYTLAFNYVGTAFRQAPSTVKEGAKELGAYFKSQMPSMPKLYRREEPGSIDAFKEVKTYNVGRFNIRLLKPYTPIPAVVEYGKRDIKELALERFRDKEAETNYLRDAMLARRQKFLEEHKNELQLEVQKGKQTFRLDMAKGKKYKLEPTKTKGGQVLIQETVVKEPKVYKQRQRQVFKFKELETEQPKIKQKPEIKFPVFGVFQGLREALEVPSLVNVGGRIGQEQSKKLRGIINPSVSTRQRQRVVQDTGFRIPTPQAPYPGSAQFPVATPSFKPFQGQRPITSNPFPPPPQRPIIPEPSMPIFPDRDNNKKSKKQSKGSSLIPKSYYEPSVEAWLYNVRMPRSRISKTAAISGIELRPIISR